MINPFRARVAARDGVTYCVCNFPSDKIYLSGEDGDMLVVEAGATFKHIGTNAMGETLMSTPALSDGVMYVRGASTLLAIGRK